MNLNQAPDRTIAFEGQTYLYFGGTSYLGLPTHPEFCAIVIQNILQWGTAYGSSRKANIQLNAYKNGEDFMAQFLDFPKALTVSSGTLAAQLVLQTLSIENPTFYHFPNIHPAIQHKNSLPLLIENQLNPSILNSKKEKIILLAEAVASQNCYPTDFSILAKIPKNKEITLVIDESHSLGILGKNGQGLGASIQLPNCKRKIVVASLGKAFGLTGGIIASDTACIEGLESQNSFVSAAGMNPALVQTLADAASLFKSQHQKLKHNLLYLQSQLKPNSNFEFNPEYPVIYPKNDSVSLILKENNIISTHFNYPTASKSLDRIVISAYHTTADLQKLATVLNSIQG